LAICIMLSVEIAGAEMPRDRPSNGLRSYWVSQK